MDYGIGLIYKIEYKTARLDLFYTCEILEEDDRDIKVKDRDGKILILKKDNIQKSELVR